MNTFTMLILALAIACGAALFTLLFILIKPWELLSSKTVKGQKNRYELFKLYQAINLKFYNLLNKFAPTRLYIKNLAHTFKHMYVLEDDESKVKAISCTMTTILVGALTLIISMKYYKDTFLSLVTTYMMISYTYQKIIGDGRKFLEELEEMLGDMVHMYNAEGKNIDRMFGRLLEDKKAYMYRYVDQMYTYLKRAILSDDETSAITEYNNIVASRHLRLIFNYLYITYRYGDETSITGEQLFNRNMMAIQREVHSDLTKLIRIKDATMGEQWFIILSVAMIPAATWYMDKFFTFDGFETISRFINSSLGQTTKVVCAVVAVICFYTYSKFMSSNRTLELHKESSWEEIAIKRIHWLRNFIDFISPRAKSPRRKKLVNKLAMSENYTDVRSFYLKKILCCITFTAIAATLLCYDAHLTKVSIMHDLYKGTNKQFMDTVISMQNDAAEYAEQSISNDLLVMDLLKKHKDEYFSLSDRDTKLAFIREIIKDNNIDYGNYPEIAAERIYEKFVLMDGISIKFIALILILVAIASYKVPNMALWLNLKLNTGAIIYDEVNGYYTVVMLLINHSASNVYMVLNWITNFASVFKKRLQSCVDNLSAREIKELEVGIEYKPFSRLIECILLAYNGTDLKSAFAGIEQKHMFQEESRRLVTEQVVQRRVWYSEILSWGAMGTTFILYIMLPMGYSIWDMLVQIL